MNVIEEKLQKADQLENEVDMIREEIHEFVVPYFHAYLNDIPPFIRKPPTRFDIPEYSQSYVDKKGHTNVQVSYWVCGGDTFYELDTRWFKYSVEDFVKVATRLQNFKKIRDKREKDRERYRQLKYNIERRRKQYEELKKEFEGLQEK